MDRFKEYFNNVSRGVLLAIGLVVIAGLVAATFIYGDDETANNQPQQQEEAAEQTVNGEGVENEEEAAPQEEGTEDENGTVATTEGEDEHPGELAQTGPELTGLLAAALLGVFTWGYRYSSSRLNHTIIG